MKKILSILLTIAMCLPVIAQEKEAKATVRELRGKVIGSTGVDYSTGQPSTTVNSKEKAFDNDLGTFFSSYDRSYTWVGLDLNRPYVIKKIAFASREYFADRMTLGVFEGANHKDFSDAVPLHVIKEEPIDNQLVTVDVKVTKGFRYVRYVGPDNVRCNISELKFYGIPGVGSRDNFYTVTNIPTVSIHTSEGKDVNSKDYYRVGMINFITQEGKNIFTDSLYIKGRGNASWSFPKKPYRLKLFNKARLPGMSTRSKNWTLVNNYGDKTLFRNCLAFQMSRCFNMTYTPDCQMVDVIFNGEYKGTYQLCDKIEIREGRVDITKMQPTDNTYPNVTGGYLLEVDGYAYSEKSMFSSSIYGMPITIKAPDEDDITPSQHKYIEQTFNQMEMRLHSPQYLHPFYGYKSMFDNISFLKHMMVGELSGNTDTYHSVYIYKDRAPEKFYTGPVWDFDLAFDNDSRTYPIDSHRDYIFRTGGTCVNGMRKFADRIIDSSQDELREEWSKARYDRGLTYQDFMNHVDSLSKLISESQVLNFMRWPILSTRVHLNPQATGSFDKEVQIVRRYLEKRFKWLDNKIGLTPVGIEDLERNETSIHAGEGKISVSGISEGGIITVYDTSGLTVDESETHEGGTTINLQPGIYIVKIDNGIKVIRKKVLVQ